MPQSRFTPVFVCLCLCVAGAISLRAADLPEEKSPSNLSLHPKDGHSVKADRDRVVIDVRSERGIGRTSIRSADGTWPERVLLRLHLRGLEHFEISNGTHALASSVASTKDAAPRPTHVTKGEGPARLEIDNQVGADHPLALDIHPVPSDKEKPSIPLDGYFEIEIPAELLRSKPREIRIRWIDFYRG